MNRFINVRIVTTLLSILVSGEHGASLTQAAAIEPDSSTATLTTNRLRDQADRREQDVDPKNDDWETEVFAEQASAQLNRLGELLHRSRPLALDGLAKLAVDDFSGTQLRPSSLEPIFSDQTTTVFRPSGVKASHTIKQRAGLAKAIEDLRTPLQGAKDGHFKFKLFRVTPGSDQIKTTSYFELSGVTATGSLQINATWDCHWTRADSTQAPRLTRIEVHDYTEVVTRATTGTLFSDCTASVFRNTSAYQLQFRHGIDYWRSRLESYFGIYFDGHHGLALADVDGDGLEDLYVCEPGGLANRLLLQTADGSLRDVSADSGINFLDYTRSALLIDLDNDGDQDLVLPIERQIQVFANNGKGQFTPQAQLPVDGQTAYSLCAADYDNDGKLDFYACFYHGQDDEETDRLPAPIPYHDARTGGPNQLFRNEGNWQFRNVTDEVGLNHNNDRWSLAAAWEDIDNDGDQDLYVANDFGRNNLYRNDDGKFRDLAGPAGAEDMNFGMSASFGDYNRDGWMDLYVSNMFSAAGGRIAHQPQFQTESSPEIKAAYQQLARGNTLLENQGDGSFRDVSSAKGVTLGRWAWASLFADINNDGWEDLLVANGFVTGQLPDDL